MRTHSRRRFTALLSGALVAAPAIVGAREAWPSRPVRIIVPWPPGGGVDVFGRLIQAPLARAFGQTVVIENIGGGSGRVGSAAAARAPADGYTFLLANDTLAATEALPVAGTATLRSAFTPVTLGISAPQGVFTHPGSGIDTIEAFAAAARERPGKLNVGVPGIGSSQHLTSELLLRAAGDLRVTHVPYRGGGPAIQDLLVGTIDAIVVTFAAAAQQAASGQLKALTLTSARRTRAFPNLPTAGETIAPGFVQTTWMGLFAPVGTPDEPRARLHAATLAALQDPVVAERLGSLGFEPVGLDGAGFAKLFGETIDTFANIVADRNIVAGD